MLLRNKVKFLTYSIFSIGYIMFNNGVYATNMYPDFDPANSGRQASEAMHELNQYKLNQIDEQVTRLRDIEGRLSQQIEEESIDQMRVLIETRDAVAACGVSIACIKESIEKLVLKME